MGKDISQEEKEIVDCHGKEGLEPFVLAEDNYQYRMLSIDT